MIGLDNFYENKNQSFIVEQMRQAIHGGGTNENSINRWFDKCIQVNELKLIKKKKCC